MGTVLDFKDDSLMMTAMGDLRYEFIDNVVTMDKEEVMRLLYTVKKGDQSVEVTKDVPIKSKKNLLHVMWWCDHGVSLRT
eukprot:4765138-Ditylum_brightwellii.AAC.1